MNMSDQSTWILGLSVIAVVLLLLKRMERLVSERGSIFQQDREGKFYPFPLFLGLLVLGFSVAAWLASMQLYLFFAAGIALVLYGLGFEGFLVLLQGSDLFEQDGIDTPAPGIESKQI